MDLQSKNITSNPIRLDTMTKTTPHSIGTHKSYATPNPSASLHEGQIIKGEITDLRNNEVTVTLEDNTSVTGQLADSSQLSIGQTASFKIIELTPTGIALEALSHQQTNSQNIIIMKALEEAGLPKNDKNKEIVKELLDNQMAINKQGIQRILQQSYNITDVSIGTIVAMNKHNLPIQQNIATQFEQYRNSEHSLLKEITSLSETLPALLQALSENGPDGAVIDFGSQLLSIINSNPSKETSLIPSPDLTFLSLEERTLLADTLETFLLPDETTLLSQSGFTKDAILAGAVPSKDMNSFLQQTLSSLVSNEIEISEPLNAKNILTSLVEKITTEIQSVQQSNQEIGGLLNQEQRQQLISLLEPSSLSPNLINQIQTGEAKISDVLIAIENNLQDTPGPAVKTLFQSEPFQLLFRECIQNAWTITPANLAQKEKVDSLYPNMVQNLSHVSQLIQSSLSGEDSANLSKQANSMSDNISFMKLLNEMFAYIQLPIKAKNQNIHTDLYVYTKKKDLKDHPHKTDVLLHLDMEHLGPLDIHIELNHQSIESKFFCHDNMTKALLQNNMVMLEDALAEKGYLFHAELVDAKKKVDIVKDFIEQDTVDTGVKRYTFDIRA